MAKFKKGDKVRILDGSTIGTYTGGWLSQMSKYVGKVATINHVEECSNGRTGYYMKEFIFLYDERGLELANPETIVIYRKDNKVIALDKSTGKKTEARCNPADEFDFMVGAKLAFERLTREKKSGELLNTRVVFNKSDSFFTAGKIYDIVDGKIHDKRGGRPVPLCTAFHNMDEVIAYFGDKSTGGLDGQWWNVFDPKEAIEVREDD